MYFPVLVHVGLRLNYICLHQCNSTQIHVNKYTSIPTNPIWLNISIGRAARNPKMGVQIPLEKTNFSLFSAVSAEISVVSAECWSQQKQK